VKQRQRDVLQVRVGALLTAHQPGRSLELVPDPALNIHTALAYEPVGLTASAGATASPVGFGLLRCGYLPRGLAFGRLPVKRGRWGSKPAETLQILQPLPEELLALPALRLRGMLKGLAPALQAVLAAAPSGVSRPVQPPAAEPTTAQLWLAVELALQGCLPTAVVRHFASERAEPYPVPAVKARPGGKQDVTAALIEQDGLLLWRNWLVRQATRLAEILRQARHHNPFRTELAAPLAARLLQLAAPEAAPAILEQLAHDYHLKPQSKAPPSWLLSGELSPPPPVPGDAAAAAAIFGQFQPDGTGPQLSEVRAQHLSRLHVVAWLLDAGRMFELPGGRLVTAGWLERSLAVFPLRHGKPGPSVRELKDRLGYGRRDAEGLRAWYLQQGAT
jgi:hypothetical protein